MPPSTLDRSRTRAKASDWVVVVPGQQPAIRPDPAALLVAPAPAPVTPVIRPGLAESFRRALPSLAVPTAVRAAFGQIALVAALFGAFVLVMGLTTGRNPALVFGLTAPHFVAYQGTTAEGVRFVLDDGMSQTAAVPGALLMDWSENRTQPPMRLTMGDPAVEPEVAHMTADGKHVQEIRYRSSWPGIDAEIRAQRGGFAANFIVQPGVDPSVIELEYVGATDLTVDAAGRLHIRGAGGVWIDGTPESWQDGPSGREPVESRYELRGDGKFGFILGSYDASRPLIVDPPSEKSN